MSDDVTDRQKRSPDFDHEALEQAEIAMFGAGGIGSEIGEGLARKGIGKIKAFDRDLVDRTNLNRQMFFEKDLNKPKGCRLAVNLSKHSFCGTKFEGYPLHFEDALAIGVDLSCTVAVAGIDDRQSRVRIARHYHTKGIPLIVIAVDLVGENGYVFIQEAGKACFGCAFFKSLRGDIKLPCRTPAVKDCLKVVAGLALYAIDSLIMDRPRGWNYRNVHLAGFGPSNALNIERRDDCPICGRSSEGV